jgi:hypothetical protein
MQQFFVRGIFNREHREIPVPCRITLTRQSNTVLDDDNLMMSLKWVRDELSECILKVEPKFYKTKKGKLVQMKGRADSDPRIKWEYKQEKKQRLGVKIEIEPLDLSDPLQEPSAHE